MDDKSPRNLFSRKAKRNLAKRPWKLRTLRVNLALSLKNFFRCVSAFNQIIHFLRRTEFHPFDVQTKNIIQWSNFLKPNNLHHAIKILQINRTKLWNIVSSLLNSQFIVSIYIKGFHSVVSLKFRSVNSLDELAQKLKLIGRWNVGLKDWSIER